MLRLVFRGVTLCGINTDTSIYKEPAASTYQAWFLQNVGAYLPQYTVSHASSLAA
jgi:hypothetical protein